MLEGDMMLNIPLPFFLTCISLSRSSISWITTTYPTPGFVFVRPLSQSRENFNH